MDEPAVAEGSRSLAEVAEQHPSLAAVQRGGAGTDFCRAALGPIRLDLSAVAVVLQLRRPSLQRR